MQYRLKWIDDGDVKFEDCPSMREALIASVKLTAQNKEWAIYRRNARIAAGSGLYTVPVYTLILRGE